MPNIIMNHDSLTKTLIFLNYPLLIDKQEKWDIHQHCLLLLNKYNLYSWSIRVGLEVSRFPFRF